MFFRKKKTPFNTQQPNTIKNGVSIVCPVCQHEQIEPKMALSTNCKKCNTYFKIVKGKAVPPEGSSSAAKLAAPKALTEGLHESPTAAAANQPQSVSPEPAPQRAKTPKKPTASIKENSIKQPTAPTTTEPIETAINQPAQSPAPIAPSPEAKVTPPPSPVSPATSSHTPTSEVTSTPPIETTQKRYAPVKKETSEPANSGLFGKGKVKVRDISCFECNHSHQALVEASSTNCPQCGTYITLKDFEIRDQWNQRIQTRGNVTIYKKATVTGITIHCHHLLVQGQFTGGVNCSGDFTLNSHGKIMGEVKCKRLIIEKRANIEFASHVYAEEIFIDGAAVGNFTCSGKLQLKKKATITGDITVKTMTMEEGAKHNGRMSIGQ